MKITMLQKTTPPLLDRKSALSRAISQLLVVAMALPAPMATAWANEPGRETQAVVSLLGIDVQEAPQTTVITVHGSTVPTFTTYRLDKPQRLIVDVVGANVTANEPRFVQNGVVRSVEAVPFKRGAANFGRVIVTFEQDALYHVRAEGNSVVIVVDGSDRKLNQAQTAQVAAAEEAARTAAQRERDLAAELRKSRQREEDAQTAQHDAQVAQRKLQDDLDALKQQAGDKAALEAKQAEISQSAAALDAANQRLKEEQDAAKKLREQLNQERQSLAAVIAQRQSEEARIELLRQKITELQRDTQRKDDARIAGLQAELERARKQAEQLRTDARDIAGSRRTAQAEEVAHLKKVLAGKDAELQGALARSDAASKAQAAQLKQELGQARDQLKQTQTALERAAKADAERELAERKWREAEQRAVRAEQELAARTVELSKSRAETADLARQKKEADARATEVARLLTEREREIEGVKLALKERESLLTAELAAAKDREAAAAKAGRQTEAEQAARERTELEKRQSALTGELAVREKELVQARHDAADNQQARAQAEQEAERLRAELANREQALRSLQQGKSTADQKKLAEAEAQVQAARAQLQSQLAERDQKMAALQKQVTGELAQMHKQLEGLRGDLAAAKQETRDARETAQTRELELQATKASAQEREKALQAAKETADNRAAQVARLLDERERQIGAMRTDLQTREATLTAELTQAKAREVAAQKAGKKAEVEAAAKTRTALEKEQSALRKDLASRERDLASARQEADKNATARRQAEQQAETLRQELAHRETELETLRAAGDGAARKKLGDAEARVAATRQQLQVQLADRDRQLAATEQRLQAQMDQVKAELARTKAESARKDRELTAAREQEARQKKLADQVSTQLHDREEEIAGLRKSVQAREARLQAAMTSAREAEHKAQREGRAQDAAKAKAERTRLEVQQADLRKELTAQQASLADARQEAARQAEARQKAEADARRLQSALADREQALAALQSTSASAAELEHARKSVEEARARLSEQEVAQAARLAEMQTQFDGRLAKMQGEMLAAHARELADLRAEREAREKQSQERAARVEGLLKDRESELKRLQDEVKVREMTLAAQLEDAKAREQEASAKGQEAEARKAAVDRQKLETAMARLQDDVKAHELALASAQQDAKAQADARAQAEQQVQSLTVALREREQALASARQSGGTNAGRVAEAQADLDKAQLEHSAALAARDAQIQKLEQDVEARIAQVREELAVEHKKREAALAQQMEKQSEQYEARIAMTEAQAQKASEHEQKLSTLLSQRERELKALQTQLGERLANLDAETADAKARELAAQKSGQTQAAAAAVRDQKRLQRELGEARKQMREREVAINTARTEAISQQKAREETDKRARALTATLEARAAELQELQRDSKADRARVAAAEKAVTEAKARLEATERARADADRATQKRLEQEIASVRKQMAAEAAAREKALADQYAARESELQSQLKQSETRRKAAESTAAKTAPMDDYLKRQQARIAVLESRADRERESRQEVAKLAQDERKRAEELQQQLAEERAEKAHKDQELETLRRQAAQADAAAKKAQQRDVDKQAAAAAEKQKTLAAQAKAKDEDGLRREAGAERQRARQDRGGDVQGTLIQDVAITAEGKERGHLVLPLNAQIKASQVVVLSRDAHRLVLRVTGARVPERLQKTYDTGGLQGPMDRVTVFSPEGQKEEVRVVVDLNEGVTDRLRVEGDRVLWDFERLDARATNVKSAFAQKGGAVKTGGEGLAVAPQPAQAAEDPSGGGGAPPSGVGGGSAAESQGVNADPIRAPWRKARRYTGKRINLTIKDADIQHVLTFLAKEGKVNIIAGPEVSGKVTFHLENIPWDLALDVILRARDLDYVRQSGVIRVSTREALRKEFEQEVERRQKLEDVKQLVVRIIPVNYSQATEIARQAKELNSKKGTSSVDTRTNALIVKDTEEHVAAIEEMVRKLDTQTPQVLIEARIVEAQSSFSRDVGVQWGGNFAASSLYGNETGLSFPSALGIAGGADSNGGTAGLGSSVPITTPNYAVNLPAAVGSGAGGAIGFSLGSLGGAANLNLRLSAAETEGTVKIVSSPKVLTLDNTTATISQGVQIPISVVSAQGVQTRFFDARLLLSATPHITQDGNIAMKVRITKNEPDFSNRAADGNPSVNTREAQTDLLLGDGETTVIGGIYTRSTSTAIKKVPILGDLPFIGVLFRSHSDQDKRTELLIFITPRIVNRSTAISVGK